MGGALVAVGFLEDVDERKAAVLDIEHSIPAHCHFTRFVFDGETKAADVDCLDDSDGAIIEGENGHADRCRIHGDPLLECVLSHWCKSGPSADIRSVRNSHQIARLYC
jgi:hypothetical protein